MNPPIPQHLIEKALELTGKTMEDMNVKIGWDFDYGYECSFSIEKFCYYLLSPEFIDKYYGILQSEGFYRMKQRNTIFGLFGEAIYEYQLGNEQPLISLLEKI